MGASSMQACCLYARGLGCTDAGVMTPARSLGFTHLSRLEWVARVILASSCSSWSGRLGYDCIGLGLGLDTLK